MSDIFREVDEDLRRDQFVAFWKRYGVLIIVAAILVVAATAGNVGWKYWRTTQMEERTAVLAQALSLLRSPTEGAAVDTKAAADAMDKAATQLGRGHAILARLYEAGLRAKDGQRDQAVALYDKVAASDDIDPILRDLAILSSVQLQMDNGDAAALRQRIEPLTRTGNTWRASATELSALLSIQTGDVTTGLALLQQLAQDATIPQGVRARASELAALYAAPK